MDDMHKVKVSVLLPESLHHQLKRASVERRTSIQQIMEEIAHGFLGSGQQDHLSPETDQPPPTPREIRTLQSKLKAILESGDRVAIMSCISTITALDELLISKRRREPG